MDGPILSELIRKIKRMSASADRRAGEFLALDYARRADLLAGLLAGLQRDRARLDAEQTRLLTAMHIDAMPNADGTEALDKAWTREEVALILRVSAQTAGAIMTEAHDLVTRCPATLAMLERGEIGYRLASRLVEACYGLDDPTAAAVEERVLKRAAEQSLSQFCASVRRAVASLAPKKADGAFHDAIAERRVAFTARTDGTGEMWSLLPAPGLAAVEARIRELATQWKKQNPDDDRSRDQREADALIALVLGNTDQATGPLSVKPVVNVTVALSTLLELDQQPGELDGHGPIPAALARALAFDPNGTWRRLLTDSNNRLVDLSVDTYKPPVNMARFVKAQHPRCCFPGCRRRAAINTELDHILDWQYGGRTTPTNLQPLCTRHHHVKHEAGWTVHREPDGTTIWSSPTGHRYARPPEDLPIDSTTDPPGEAA